MYFLWLLQGPIRIGTRVMEITGIKVMGIMETMATTIKAMVDTGAMITRVTTTSTDMVTTAVCNTVCENTERNSKEIMYRGLFWFLYYDTCALNDLGEIHALYALSFKHRHLEYSCILFLTVFAGESCFNLMYDKYLLYDMGWERDVLPSKLLCHKCLEILQQEWKMYICRPWGNDH